MAIYHMSAKMVSRGDGRSSTAAAAYRACCEIVDARTGEVHNFSRKEGHMGGGVVLPTGTTIDRAQLWNAVEKKHYRDDAVVAREIEVALPHELTDAERLEAVQQYARELADTYGVAVDYNIHADDNNRNHHVHILLSACACDATGKLGNKAVALDPIHCQRAKILNPMEVQRERWEVLCNSYLEKYGHTARIDHRSLKDQGITDRLPQSHRGPAVTAILRRGGKSTVNERIKQEEQEYKETLQTIKRLEGQIEEVKTLFADPVVNYKKLRARYEEIETKLLQPAQQMVKKAQDLMPKAVPQADKDKAEAALKKAKAEYTPAKKKVDAAERRIEQLGQALEELFPLRFIKRRQLQQQLEQAKADRLEAARVANQAVERQRAAAAVAELPTLEKVAQVLEDNTSKVQDAQRRMRPLEQRLVELEPAAAEVWEAQRAAQVREYEARQEAERQRMQAMREVYEASKPAKRQSRTRDRGDDYGSPSPGM